jgi:threonine aldolase
MATLRGEQGSVQFETGSGTLANVVGTRSWSFTATKETYDTTAHGATSRTFVGGLVSGSGSVEIVYDPDANNQPELIEDVFKANDAVDANFELFTTGSTTSTDSLKFAGIVTSMNIVSTVGELVVASCDFITSGDIDSSLE